MPEPVLRAPVVLLVEANEDERDMYAAFLRQAGFSLLTARSAGEAFSLAASLLPDLIIVDVRLPGGPDGLTLAAKLRVDARTRHIRIIAVTSDAFTTARDRALAAGCDVFLTKPCLPTVLTHHAQTLTAA